MSAKSDENIVVIDGRRVRINEDGSVTQLDGDVISKKPAENVKQAESNITDGTQQKSAESFKTAKEKLRLKIQAGLSLSMAKDKENF